MTDTPRVLQRRSLDDRLSLWGAAVGALGLVWLVFTRLLALSGRLGFVLLWFAAFLALYALATHQSNPWPVVKDRIAGAVTTAGACVVGFALLTTVWFVVGRGQAALVGHGSFFTHDMSGVRPTSPLSQGGALHAVVGSALEVLIAIVISVPVGIATAVYMTEVGGGAAKTVRTVVEAMTALPDILAGLFVYSVLILALGWERTGLAAAVALSVTMLPIVARTAEVALRVVPGGLREASLALGASQLQTVRRVVLPTARAGLMTSLVLGVARVAGETAPLLIVSGASTFFNANPTHQPMNSLPLYIFSAVRSGEPLYVARGFAAAVLLLAVVTSLFAYARYLARPRAGAR